MRVQRRTASHVIEAWLRTFLSRRGVTGEEASLPHHQEPTGTRFHPYLPHNKAQSYKHITDTGTASISTCHPHRGNRVLSWT